MNVLKNKQTKSYEYTSRYSSFPFYYNTKDDKYVYGVTSQLEEDTTYVIHYVSQEDTLDSLSFKYYGRPDYYWIIAYFNDVQDAFSKLYDNYTQLKIPSLSNVQFK